MTYGYYREKLHVNHFLRVKGLREWILENKKTARFNTIDFSSNVYKGGEKLFERSENCAVLDHSAF